MKVYMVLDKEAKEIVAIFKSEEEALELAMTSPKLTVFKAALEFRCGQKLKELLS